MCNRRAKSKTYRKGKFESHAIRRLEIVRGRTFFSLLVNSNVTLSYLPGTSLSTDLINSRLCYIFASAPSSLLNFRRETQEEGFVHAIFTSIASFGPVFDNK